VHTHAHTCTHTHTNSQHYKVILTQIRSDSVLLPQSRETFADAQMFPKRGDYAETLRRDKLAPPTTGDLTHWASLTPGGGKSFKTSFLSGTRWRRCVSKILHLWRKPPPEKPVLNSRNHRVQRSRGTLSKEQAGARSTNPIPRQGPMKKNHFTWK